jgi:hypothetical protein
MVEEARLRPASGIALQRPVVATLSGQEVGDFDPARGGGFCPANGAKGRARPTSKAHGSAMTTATAT